MQKLFKISFLIVLFVATTSLAVHKFYVAIYQIEHNISKNRLEVTTRIFIDDLEIALEKKFNKKIDLYNSKNTTVYNELVTKYIKQEFSIKVDGQIKQFVFKSSEIENNVLICYFTIPNIQKIKILEVENSILTEIFDEQQNIIQTHFNGDRQSTLLTLEKTKGMLK